MYATFLFQTFLNIIVIKFVKYRKKFPNFSHFGNIVTLIQIIVQFILLENKINNGYKKYILLSMKTI